MLTLPCTCLPATYLHVLPIDLCIPTVWTAVRRPGFVRSWCHKTQNVKRTVSLSSLPFLSRSSRCVWSRSSTQGSDLGLVNRLWAHISPIVPHNTERNEGTDQLSVLLDPAGVAVSRLVPFTFPPCQAMLLHSCSHSVWREKCLMSLRQPGVKSHWQPQWRHQGAPVEKGD